ncbi:uncharacterized protein LOC121970642 [Zingiber officinale]|uniref:Disease resistance R13L4/SHOC-2-like LRR domain-containing protein n=1 Tax=Zingiber officinale TaxID=94328 RepID=A0A8J5LE62_ZINOF|nr:uncharacterized protein LOC121970642 [Zingiber officinale]KAG6515026.1 hypothetical protein ZIOFF_025404 [Zingiber officinale]
MWPCSGSSVEIISRLLMRLDGVARGSLPEDFNDKFKNIRNEMVKLKSMLDKDTSKENKAMEELGQVARCIDEIMTTDSKSLDPKFLERNLESIDKALNKALKVEVAEKDPQKVVPEEEEEPPEELSFAEREIQKSSAWGHLKLVVDCLEQQLKKCLFTISVFPPNAVIKKRLLFHWWMGEDIIKNIEDGKRCFDHLIAKGFIIPIKKLHCDKDHYCQIQTWIRRLLIDVANTNAFLEYDESGHPSEDYTRSHRFCLSRKHQLFKATDEEADRSLRTVYNISKQYIELPPDWLVNKTEMTTMHLGRWREQTEEDKKQHIEVRDNEFLAGLGNCRNLKYLSFRGISRVEKLPDSTEKLTKLLTLDLRACHNLEKLPPDIGSIKRLQFLDVSECYLLDHIPKTLSSLSELEVLKGFVVGDYTNRNHCQLGDLGKLAKLRKLSINTGREFRNEELKAIGTLEKVTTLIITWGVVQKESQPVAAAAGGAGQPSVQEATKREIRAEASQSKQTAVAPTRDVADSKDHQAKRVQTTKGTTTPAGSTPTQVLPPNLEKLDLRCFNKERLPEWIDPEKLKKLEKLYLRGGSMLTSLILEGKTWSATVLRVRYLKKLEDSWSSLHASFPKLQRVEKFNCELLHKWPCDDEGFWQKEDEVGESSKTARKIMTK